MMIRFPALALALPLALLPAAGRAGDPVTVEGAAKAIDGGTLSVAGVTLRLAGIVAPGPRQKCRDGALPWLCGAAARGHLTELIGDAPVTCQAQDTGVATCRAGDADLSAAMVRDGWAVAEPAVDAYKELEAEARAAKRGLWEKTP